MRTLILVVITVVPLLAVFIADAAYARGARAEGRDPADNPVARWLKANPAKAWLSVLVILLVYGTIFATLWD